jgi:hypothetical protein
LECLHLWEGLKVYPTQDGTTYSIQQVGDGRMTFAFVRGVTGDLPIVIAVWSGGRRASRKICCVRNKSECLDSADVGHNIGPTGDELDIVTRKGLRAAEGSVSLQENTEQAIRMNIPLPAEDDDMFSGSIGICYSVPGDCTCQNMLSAVKHSQAHPVSLCGQLLV